MDTCRLLAGNGGVMMDNFCLRPEINSMMCDVRLLEEKEPLLPNTKAILILGEAAMHKLLPETLSNTLNEMRGTLFSYKGIPTICSYLPQNAVDIYKDYEAENNVLASTYIPNDSVSEDGEEDEDEGDVKRHGRTKRTNFAFWLKKDCQKIKLILGFTKAHPTLTWPPNQEQPKYFIYPNSSIVTHELLTHKNEYFYFDMETDFDEANLQCFAFCFGDGPIYSVPILDYNYHPAYSDYYKIMGALAVAIRDNVIIAHNGANFDFLVLAYKYHIAIRRAYDTLIAAHRCMPDIEKSLGHQTSLWTWEKFHKDEDSLGYHTQTQMTDRMRYCGKDVHTMRLNHKSILKYATTIPGLQQSIQDAMDCIRPYLISTLHGINVNADMVNEMVIENDKLMVQYNRLIEWFIGEWGMQAIRGKKKLGMFAGSNKQCTKYFHELLGYKVMSKGKPDKFGVRNPSLGKKALYKLALLYDNPVIYLICAYRGVKKETTRLRFIPFDFKKYERT